VKTKSVLVALSGGMDSAAAAILLSEAGYKVSAVTMRLGAGGSFADNVVARAAAVAKRLGLPHRTVDFSDAFRENVIANFLNEYRRGRTPNPCVRCNRDFKFGELLDYAGESGYDFLATGHYARIIEQDGFYHLLKGADRLKDQSYFLYTLGPAALPRILFPLGERHKAEARKLAAARGIGGEDYAGSQDICFLGGGSARDFIAGSIEPQPGDIVDGSGNLLGRHRGIAHYTVGQRYGLGDGTGRRYVIRIEAARNRLVAGGNEELAARRLFATGLSWVAGAPPPEPLEVSARIRYRAAAAAAELTVIGDNAAVRFAQPQRAVAPGQSVVFYQGDTVLGGGIISGSAGEQNDEQ